MSSRTLRGVVHGNTIELIGDPGAADGEEVEIVVRRLGTATPVAGEGLRRTEGALADDAEWDAIMEGVQSSRKQFQ